MVLPLATVPPQGRLHGHACGAHDAFVNEPERVPSLQARLSATVPQEAPQATEVAEYAGTAAPWAMVPPQGSVHEAHGATVHEAFAYAPESTPSVQVRVSELQESPQATEDVRYPVVSAPLATLPPQGGVHEQAPTVHVSFV